MYKLFKFNDEVVGACKTDNLFRVCFNFTDPDNTDYQAYLEWLAAGNTPEPAEDA